MKNTPVNNDYVQNLQEGLLNETRRRPEGTPMGDLQAADSENRKEKLQDHANETAARDGGSGVASDIEHGRDEADIRAYGGSRQPKKVRGAKAPRPYKNTAGRILKKVDENAQAGYPEEGIKGGTVEAKKREYKEKVEDKKRERLAAAPALASLQNQKN